MEKLSFKKIEFDEPIIDILHRQRGPRGSCAINQATYTLLKECEKFGGFIAGGFASRVARAHLTKGDIRSDVEAIDYIMRYTVSQDLSKGFWGTRRKYAKFKVGDIDVYFENLSTSGRLIESTLQFTTNGNYIVDETPAGFGVEMGCFGSRDGQIVQLITKYAGTYEEVTSTFDIYNAACVIKENTLYIPEEWEWLAKNRYLHLRKWNGPWVLQRMSKWCNKHGYNAGLTPETIRLLNDNITQMLDDPEKTKTQYDAYRFIFKQIHPFMTFLRPEHLMQITSYYPDTAYNYALEELRKRSEKSLSRVDSPTKLNTDNHGNLDSLLDD